MIKFKIPGKVKAKQSTRFTRGGIRYTPKDVVNYANWVRLCFQKSYPEHLPSVFFEKPLSVVIDVYYAIPKSFSKKKQRQALQGDILPMIKPDWDNISKNICDALNGVAYPDDRQITAGSVYKHYAEDDYVEVLIKRADT